MNRDDQRDDALDLDAENQLSELMQAHLDEVEGGGAHSSWKRSVRVADFADDAGA